MDDDGRHVDNRREDGFTLIELMVVVLIIGILIAIALPSYLGARTRAEDRAAQTDLRSGLVAAMTYYTQAQTYTGFNAAAAATAEASLAWLDQSDPPQGVIDIEVANGMNLVLVTQSGSGSYFCLAQVANSPATDKGTGPTYADVDSVLECTGGWG